MTLQENISLKAYNTFGIEAKARYFAEVNKEEELQQLLQSDIAQQQELLILGGGSNVLLTRDFPGLVIKISITGITVVKEDAQQVWLQAMAGEVWHDLVLYCIRHGYAGIENLSLIPGQVGAAPMQNIGAYGVELEKVFYELDAVEIASGKKRRFKKDECRFGYRESVFKKELKGKYIITSVTLQLNKQAEFNTTYGALKQTLEEMQVEELTIKAVSDAVIAIRSSKLPNPEELGNAGSFFKNPVISKAQFEGLHARYPDMPHYPVNEQQVKVPAGWLIEQCGWKGKVVGHTGSHKKQALVLVNYGNATGHEVWQLAQDIQASVKEQFGISLQPEVNVI